MRNAPVPITLWFDVEQAVNIAKAQSLTTHQGIEASECCAILTFICISWFKSNDKLDTIISKCKSENKNMNKLINSISPWNWKSKNFVYAKERIDENPKYVGSYATDCLAMALHCVYTTNNFKSALLKAVNFGGDADSVGAVTGQLAGAKYGFDNIPEEWIKTIHKWTHGEEIIRAHLLFNMVNS